MHTFPSGWVNTKVHPYAWHPSVVYNAPLGVYLMANWGMGCAADGMWFGKAELSRVLVGAASVGTVDANSRREGMEARRRRAARAYQPQIVPKWIAADGKSFWLVWTDFQFVGGKRPYYSFNMQKVELVTE